VAERVTASSDINTVYRGKLMQISRYETSAKTCGVFALLPLDRYNPQTGSFFCPMSGNLRGIFFPYWAYLSSVPNCEKSLMLRINRGHSWSDDQWRDLNDQQRGQIEYFFCYCLVSLRRNSQITATYE
jgi:hypothetical protein